MDSSEQWALRKVGGIILSYVVHYCLRSGRCQFAQNHIDVAPHFAAENCRLLLKKGICVVAVTIVIIHTIIINLNTPT